MKQIVLLMLVGMVLLTSCQSDSKQNKDAAQKNPDSIINLPPLPEADRMQLYKKTIAIDVIAYNQGISMSYNDPGSIQPVLAMIKPGQGVWKKQCKPVGRISFMYDTGLGEEAEMLIHQGCKTFVWLKDGKKAYMNELTDDGLSFFTRFMPEDPSKFKMPENAQQNQ
ncbi:MAG: hypothetical protein R3275_07640 [Saprospiraceae bacterium]|nr:hypothetical protein [Saprospiraceae bacterium]